jgi:RNA 2',3'-cyclic 3'-phosphodiesterase
MRLFVALDLPWEVKEALSDLAGGLLGARWVPPENYHLTLRFIGHTERHQAEDIDLALALLRARGFSLSFSGIGVFEKAGRPQTLYAGIEKSPGLDHLRGKVETALQRVGLEPERKKFTPHVSLARLDGVPPNKLVQWVQAHSLFRLPPVPVEHFTLFSSCLGKESPVYTPEVEYALVA